MKILPGNPNDPLVLSLLREHLDDMKRHSPPESIHALSPEGLVDSDVSFWCLWRGAEVLGCGALKELSPVHGELKSMRTSVQSRRQGVGSRMLQYLIAQARRRGYERVSLETGSAAAFAPARGMYLRHGFELCGPFEGYTEDPFSVFMTKSLR